MTVCTDRTLSVARRWALDAAWVWRVHAKQLGRLRLLFKTGRPSSTTEPFVSDFFSSAGTRGADRMAVVTQGQTYAGHAFPLDTVENLDFMRLRPVMEAGKTDSQWFLRQNSSMEQRPECSILTGVGRIYSNASGLAPNVAAYSSDL
jgi:hypothetical protein